MNNSAVNVPLSGKSTTRAFLKYCLPHARNASCVKTIQGHVEKDEGVLHSRVGIISWKTDVTFDRVLVQDELQSLQALIEAAGTKVTFSRVVELGDEHSLEIKAMITCTSCVACVGNIETAVAKSQQAPPLVHLRIGKLVAVCEFQRLVVQVAQRVMHSSTSRKPMAARCFEMHVRLVGSQDDQHFSLPAMLSTRCSCTGCPCKWC
ncbi:hypothetical protein PF004_g18554 [Phytophthora fragariae]|uniref:Uncharacterized protein n=1 Tax=Phytophthora fragariae TaxID=53985 RepID=A0A6G0NC68_9STRA|nr:hypothetical protein PF004_g18554 [Phytophthora fragariae]